MPAVIVIGLWHWVGFIACVLVFLALDLGVLHRQAHIVRFREALTWSIAWFTLAMLFALALKPLRGGGESIEFLTGYFIELSLSMDNVFVISLIFSYFKIPGRLQHRVLFWGILGALVMRGTLIGLGVALIVRLQWILYALGAFLIYSGAKMCFAGTEVEPAKNPILRLTRKLYPVSPGLDGQKFTTVWNGRKALTPLALVLVLVETTDLIFAADSIPAIFAVTTKPFIVFTSNVFALLGLRSLYFVLAGAIGLFRFLKYGLSLVLVFVGVKMLIDPHARQPLWFQYDIPDGAALSVVLGIILVSITLSLIQSRKTAVDKPPFGEGG